MKKILREPLLHFLVAGMILFVFWGYWGDNSEPDSEQIIVGSAEIERIEDTWKTQWRREPTEEELESLIERFIEEEVLYREALAMGLEKEDTIIRRRLAQKMQFLIQDIADQSQPDEAELNVFFEESQEQFREPARISFTHIYFNQDQPKNTGLRDAGEALVKLQSSALERAPEQGDPFMLNHDYAKITQRETAKLFGKTFAEELFTLTPGPWQGPIRSGYGIHLVRVVDYIPSRIPEFSEVAEQVRQGYINMRRQKANEEAIKALMDRYEIVIDVNASKREGSQTAALSPSGDNS
jgi:hypothetical protein